MIITRTNPFSGKVIARELDITQESYQDWFLGVKCIQHAFPHLSADDREFILTGMLPEDWDNMFSDSSEEEILYNDTNNFDDAIPF